MDCVKEAGRTTPQARTRYGAPARSDTRPLVTWTLLGICVAVYLGQMTISGLTSQLSFIGVLAGSQPWRFITSAFVHSPTSLLHILFNMYILYAFGPVLEQLLGRAKFLAAYLLCAVGGSVGVLLLAPPDPGWFTHVVGASGAIFGLLFLYVVIALKQGQVPTTLLVMIAINLALPFFVGGIAWQAHIGGAVTGAAIGGLLTLLSAQGRSEQAVRRRRWIWPGFALVAAVLVALAVWRLLAVLGPHAFSITV